MLTLHGRTRLQIRRADGVGSADWRSIRAVSRTLDIPVVANGGVATHGCVHACLDATGAAAVMVGEALLENPALFSANRAAGGEYVDQDGLAARYLMLCEQYPPRKGVRHVKDHMRRMLYAGFHQWPDLNDELYVAERLQDIVLVVRRLKERGWEQPAFHTSWFKPWASWYQRHRLQAVGDSREKKLPLTSLSSGSGAHGRRPSTRGPACGRDNDQWRSQYLARSAAKRRGAARKRLRRAATDAIHH
jgi:tRNA-dihydrouridine synthase 1